MEYIELDLLCVHMKKVSGSQALILLNSCTEMSETEFLSIVNETCQSKKFFKVTISAGVIISYHVIVGL